MDINTFFPTMIGSATYHRHDEIEQALVDHCINIQHRVSSGGSGWMSNKTYNTSDGKYDILRDPIFSSLNSWIEYQVKQYCAKLDIDDNLIPNGAWFNIYNRNDYQEMHVHPTSVLSAIYILVCPDDGAKIFFHSPVNNMYIIKRIKQSQQTVDQITCKSVPGTLIIFPSYLKHAVERHDSDHKRISLSYNFRQ